MGNGTLRQTLKTVPRKWIIAACATLVIVFIIFAIASNAGTSEKKILGTWQVTEYSAENADFDYYPESEYITFFEDGTLSSGEDEFNYRIEGDSLILDGNALVFPHTYHFEIDGDMLMLEFSGEMPIYYNAVDLSESDIYV